VNWIEEMDKLRDLLKAEFDFKGTLLFDNGKTYPIGWSEYPSLPHNDNEAKP
jgi:hypothetical protein